MINRIWESIEEKSMTDFFKPKIPLTFILRSVIHEASIPYDGW